MDYRHLNSLYSQIKLFFVRKKRIWASVGLGGICICLFLDQDLIQDTPDFRGLSLMFLFIILFLVYALGKHSTILDLLDSLCERKELQLQKSEIEIQTAKKCSESISLEDISLIISEDKYLYVFNKAYDKILETKEDSIQGIYKKEIKRSSGKYRFWYVARDTIINSRIIKEYGWQNKDCMKVYLRDDDIHGEKQIFRTNKRTGRTVKDGIKFSQPKTADYRDTIRALIPESSRLPSSLQQSI